VSTTIPVQCNITVSNPATPLYFAAYIDNLLIFEENITTGSYTINSGVENTIDTTNHELTFILDNKTENHTILDDNDIIIEDAMITVENILFDNINMLPVVGNFATYYHSFNSSENEIITDVFHDNIGFNGKIVIPFTTPIHPWLLTILR